MAVKKTKVSSVEASLRKKAISAKTTYYDKTYNIEDCVEASNTFKRVFGIGYIPKECVVKDENGEIVGIEYSNPIITGYKDNKISYVYSIAPSINANLFISLESIPWHHVTTANKIVEICNANPRRAVFIKDYKAALELGFVDDYAQGKLVSPDMVSSSSSDKKNLRDFEKFDYPYKFRKDMSKAEKIKYGMESQTFYKTEGKRYTFGK